MVLDGWAAFWIGLAAVIIIGMILSTIKDIYQAKSVGNIFTGLAQMGFKKKDLEDIVEDDEDDDED